MSFLRAAFVLFPAAMVVAVAPETAANARPAITSHVTSDAQATGDSSRAEVHADARIVSESAELHAQNNVQTASEGQATNISARAEVHTQGGSQNLSASFSTRACGPNVAMTQAIAMALGKLREMRPTMAGFSVVSISYDSTHRWVVSLTARAQGGNVKAEVVVDETTGCVVSASITG